MDVVAWTVCGVPPPPLTHRRQFFQRENFLTLNNIRRGLGEALEEVGGRRRRELGGEEKAEQVERALAGAVASVGRAVDLVRPAGSLSGSVAMHDWVEARRELEKGTEGIRRVCDPDFGVEIVEWGRDGGGGGEGGWGAEDE